MKGKKSWRLSKTLSRHVSARPIEAADVKYAWGSYCKAGLGSMGAPFDAKGMDAAEFKSAFEKYVLENSHGCWTIIGNTKVGAIPIGFVLGAWAPGAAFMMIVGIVWFPWASKRNIVEGAVEFFNGLRKELAWMGFATSEHKKLYEACCMHGIMRRVGTSMIPGSPVAVFEGKPNVVSQ